MLKYDVKLDDTKKQQYF